MIRPLKYLLLAACLTSVSEATELKTGQSLPLLETKSGKRYEQVTIREIKKTSVKILHSGGVTTVQADDLADDYQETFSKLPAPTETSEIPEIPAAPVAPVEPAWLPSTNAEVVDCSLFVEVSSGISPGGEEAKWSGSAFLCNHGEVTYIYSNAHNFDGAKEFTIKDRKGTLYSEFVSVEIAATDQAYWKETKFGGDVVRIRLKNYVPHALSIDPKLLDMETAKNRKILVTGNTGGRGTITELEGAITKIADSQIILHNAATEPGNSGSPIVDLTTKKVIGILTWGAILPDPVLAVWNKKPPETREGINVGAGLATVRYVPTSFDQLRQQRVVMNDLKKNVRLLGLLDTLVPTKSGLFVNPKTIVMGDYTVADLLQESADHPVVKELTRLDRELRAKGGAISISNVEMLRIYEASFSRCLGYIAGQRNALETTRAATFFMKCQIKRSRIVEVCKAYEAMTQRTLLWYQAQQGTGGKGLSIDRRARLPSMSTGVKGLGIRSE